MSVPRYSLVISTLGRSHEVRALFVSLEKQTLKDFEVIVVDQNSDGRLDDVMKGWSFPLTHIKTPHSRGLSRGRNTGAKLAKGAILLFPDDDCWYPPDLLAHADATFLATNADIVCGRATDENGRSINGRFEAEKQFFGRDKVWTCQIEWMVFIQRAAFDLLGGYDEDVGVGASTPWQACEGPELTLRAAAQGLKMFYDPDLWGHHAELNTQSPDEAMVRKGRAYGRGMGYVLRKSGHSPAVAAYWVSRSAANAVLALTRLKFRRARYCAYVALGRYEGYAKVGTAPHGARSAVTPSRSIVQ